MLRKPLLLVLCSTVFGCAAFQQTNRPVQAQPRIEHRTNLIVLNVQRTDDFAVYAEEEGSYLWLPQETSDLSIQMVVMRNDDSIRVETMGGLNGACVGKTDRECTADARGGFTVYFATDSAELTKKAKKILDDAAKTYTDSEVVISGYADPRYRADYNLALSQRRADAVVQYLKSKGVKIRFAKGYGEDAEQPTYEKSRRVNVVGE